MKQHFMFVHEISGRDTVFPLIIYERQKESS